MQRCLLVLLSLAAIAYACSGTSENLYATFEGSSQNVGTVSYQWTSSQLVLCFEIDPYYCMESVTVELGSDADSLVSTQYDFGCVNSVTKTIGLTSSDVFMKLSARIRNYPDFPLGGTLSKYIVEYPSTARPLGTKSYFGAKPYDGVQIGY